MYRALNSPPWRGGTKCRGGLTSAQRARTILSRFATAPLRKEPKGERAYHPLEIPAKISPTDRRGVRSYRRMSYKHAPSPRVNVFTPS